MKKKSVIQILVDKNFLTRDKADALVLTCDEKSSNFFKCVRDFGVSEEHLAQALAEKFECPYIPEVTEQMTDPEIISQIPLKFLREQIIMPIKIGDNNSVTLLSANPFNFQPLDELTLMLKIPYSVAVGPQSGIIEAINKYYPYQSSKEVIEGLEEEKEFSSDLDFAAINEEDILGMASEAPIIKLVNHILYQGVKQGASDIHIEPFEKELRVRYRIDGILYASITPPKRAQAAIISRIKIMANLNIAEKRHPQDGRIQVKIADKAIDIRVSVLPTVYGERIVMRLLDKAKTFKQLHELGLSDRDYRVLMHSIEQPNGIILVTGPTGSGKTSTLYAILNKLNSPDVNIVTVEDPVEYQMIGIGQVQVQEKIGLTFAAALRSILRQDPDIVMIGETRDQETAQIAIQASLTGHLVLTTLHTNSSAASITRLIDMGIEPFLIASSVIAIMAQRLVRKLCEQCKQRYTPTPEVLKRIGISSQEAQNITFYKPVGCHECLNTGYSGRIPLFEIMVMTQAIARLTVERTDTALIQDAALKDGMTLLVHDGIEKIKKGITTIEEVLTVATTQEVIE
ncbi:MAG: type II secretion system ATPase GspE [Candidatus Babeliaceae bacterium]|nr:type II secretion system ATPase GspE [Candidatus Babeliaceae bacterium]